MDKLIGNFKKHFDSFSLGSQLLLLIQNPFLITDVRGFSKEVTQTVMWAHAGSLQMELIDLQANVALRACSHRQLFFQVRVDVLHYIPMIHSVFVKTSRVLLKTSLLWVVFKLGKVQLAKRKSEHVELYDMTNKLYHNIYHKESIWRTIAGILGHTSVRIHFNVFLLT